MKQEMQDKWITSGPSYLLQFILQALLLRCVQASATEGAQKSPLCPPGIWAEKYGTSHNVSPTDEVFQFMRKR